MTALSVRGLDARYGHLQALIGVNLSLDEGETLAVIGANGAGKTTLPKGDHGPGAGGRPHRARG